MDMRCPYLNADKEKSVCKVSLTNMSPSIFEMRIYCKTDNHYRCPILLARAQRYGSVNDLKRNTGI